MLLWCRWPESNRHGLFNRRILSPVRLPVPPHLHLIFELAVLTTIDIIILYKKFVNRFSKKISKNIEKILKAKNKNSEVTELYYLIVSIHLLNLNFI